MNPELLLNHVHQLIMSIHFDGEGGYHVCYWDQKLRVERCNHTKKPHLVFQILTQREIYGGLTTGQWDRLLHKLTNFFREDTKCHEPRKL